MRQLNDWLASYVAFVGAASESPLPFHIWSGLTAISATLRRRTWIGRGLYKLYPNLYTVLVGRPGLGKGSAINPVLNIVRDANTANILSDRVTIEFILERLSKGWSHIGAIPNMPGAVNVSFDHTCLLLSRELSVFLSASQATLGILTDLWDTNEGAYTYGTRGKGEIKIDSPCVTLLGGSTQEWLVSSIPANAVGGGFTRRVNFVVALDRGQLIPWPKVSSHSPIRDRLVDDLKDMMNLSGEFRFDKQSVPLFEQVYEESNPNIFDDEATSAYKTSKWAQTTKVAMCLSASRGDDLIISKEDFVKASELVDAVSNNVLRVFRGVGESDMSAATDKILTFLELKGYATKGEILKAHWRDVTFEDLDRILITLTEGDIIYSYAQGKKTYYAVLDKTNLKGKP